MFNIANNQEFIEALGIANAPEETKATLIAGLEETAQNRLVIELANILTDEQAEEFASLENPEESMSWLIKNVPNLQEIMTNVLSNMRDEILLNRQKVVG